MDIEQKIKEHQSKIGISVTILFVSIIFFVILFIMLDPGFVQQDPEDSSVDVGEGNKVCKSCGLDPLKLVGISFGFSLIPVALYIGIKMYLESRKKDGSK